MAARTTLISASEQTAISKFTARHWVSILVIVTGLIAVTVYAGHGFTLAQYALLALCFWFLRYLGGVAWWVNRRRRTLAKASLPAPSTKAMLADRKTERQRVRQIQKQWPAFCDVNGYRGVGKIVPDLRRFTSTVEGDVTCHVSPGPIAVKGGVDKLVTLTPDLREVVGMDCKEVLVQRVGVGRAVLRFLWTEAMERELPVRDMPTAPAGQIAYGHRRDGSAASHPMTHHDLLGGMTGSGKSGDVWARLADLNWQGIYNGLRYEAYVCNNKGGAELKAFAGKTGKQLGPLTVAAYTADVDGTIRVIGKFAEDMKAAAAANPYREWKPERSQEYPLRILILDEAVELMMKMDTKQRAVLDTVLSQGRANGFVVWMLSQSGQVEILKHTRNYLPSRRSLAQRDAVNTNMFLGDGAEQGGAYCSTIVNRPGLGYSYDETRRGYEMFRAARVDDDDMERIANGEVPLGMREGVGKAPVNRQCAIYYFFNTAGQSLYVGVSVDPQRRRNEHAGLAGKPAKWWWEMVDESRTVITWADTEAAARIVEEREIKRFAPVGNRQHNYDNPNAGRPPATLPTPPKRTRKPQPQVETPLNVTPINTPRRRGNRLPASVKRKAS